MRRGDRTAFGRFTVAGLAGGGGSVIDVCELVIVEAATDYASAAPCEFVLVDASGGEVDLNVTAPSSPTDGQAFAVRKVDDSDAGVVVRAGDDTELITLTDEGESVVYRYSEIGETWGLVAHDLGVGAETEFPASPIDIDPYYYYVTALLRGNGTNGSLVVADDAGNQWAVNGDAQIQSNEIALDGNNDWLSSTLQEGILGTLDLTIEGWITPSSFTTDGEILSVSNASLLLNTFTLVFEYKTNGSLRGALQNGAGASNVDITSAAGVLTLNTKKHVCFTAEGTTARLRVNGVVVASGAITGTRADNQLAARVGFLTTDLANAHRRHFAGKIEDLRVTRGICRYPGPGAVTPPVLNVPHVPAPKLLATWDTTTANDAQGVCTDGTHVWYSSSNTLYKYTRAGALVTSRNVASDPPVTGKTNALGGPQTNGLYILNGVLYVSVAQYLSNTPASWICEYDPTTLTLLGSHVLPSYGFSEGLAWGQDSWWVAFHADMRLAQYDASFNLIAEHFLDQTVTGSSGGYGPGTGYDGIAWDGDLVYLNIHETYTQKYLDVFQWNGHRFTRVHRQRRCEQYATQGMCINPADPTEMWLAMRRQSGFDAIARAALVP